MAGSSGNPFDSATRVLMTIRNTTLLLGTGLASSQVLLSQLKESKDSKVMAGDLGFSDILYFDPSGERVEEAAASNFFCITEDGVLKTPELGTILSGVTRDSILQLARNMAASGGLSGVQEGTVTWDDILSAKEAFVSGTAAAVTPVEHIGEAGQEVDLPSPGPVTSKLKVSSNIWILLYRCPRQSSAMEVALRDATSFRDRLLRPPIYWLFHSWRLFGYGVLIPPLLVYQPLKTLAGIVAYTAVHRQRWWQQSVHRFFGYGASRRHRFLNEHTDVIKDDKRYLWSLHPHGLLADGWHSLIARNLESFADSGKGPPAVGRKIALCFAPVIQHVPVHQEMYRDLCTSASRKDIVKWWKTADTDPALIPGGFSEAVFVNSAERKYEYSYLKNRKGFVRIAVEEGKDIVPCYTFRQSWMYRTPRTLRAARARLSQHIFVGIIPFFGWMGTSMPLTDKTTSVVFPPFPASEYKPDQVDAAHAGYLEHLKKYFDLYKSRFGMKDVELESRQRLVPCAVGTGSGPVVLELTCTCACKCLQ
eukprot:s1929_g6.t2